MIKDSVETRGGIFSTYLLTKPPNLEKLGANLVNVVGIVTCVDEMRHLLESISRNSLSDSAIHLAGALASCTVWTVADHWKRSIWRREERATSQTQTMPPS